MPRRPRTADRAAEARAVRREMERFLAEHWGELATVPHMREALDAYRRKIDALTHSDARDARPRRAPRLTVVR